jgi:hypothetical protein
MKPEGFFYLVGWDLTPLGPFSGPLGSYKSQYCGHTLAYCTFSPDDTWGPIICFAYLWFEDFMSAVYCEVFSGISRVNAELVADVADKDCFCRHYQRLAWLFSFPAPLGGDERQVCTSTLHELDMMGIETLSATSDTNSTLRRLLTWADFTVLLILRNFDFLMYMSIWYHISIQIFRLICFPLAWLLFLGHNFL